MPSMAPWVCLQVLTSGCLAALGLARLIAACQSRGLSLAVIGARLAAVQRREGVPSLHDSWPLGACINLAILLLPTGLDLLVANRSLVPRVVEVALIIACSPWYHPGGLWRCGCSGCSDRRCIHAGRCEAKRQIADGIEGVVHQAIGRAVRVRSATSPEEPTLPGIRLADVQRGPWLVRLGVLVTEGRELEKLRQRWMTPLRNEADDVIRLPDLCDAVRTEDHLQRLRHVQLGAHDARRVAEANPTGEEERLEVLGVSWRGGGAHQLLAKHSVDHRRLPHVWVPLERDGDELLRTPLRSRRRVHLPCTIEERSDGYALASAADVARLQGVEELDDAWKLIHPARAGLWHAEWQQWDTRTMVREECRPQLD
mmetsp:Transcript_91057/g.266621  ORF Transcript_91057/g.266621 Transcript_91057/m.266621 type:complete len:370 (-) Transcript_91057:255-1364(-)